MQNMKNSKKKQLLPPSYFKVLQTNPIDNFEFGLKQNSNEGTSNIAHNAVSSKNFSKTRLTKNTTARFENMKNQENVNCETKNVTEIITSQQMKFIEQLHMDIFQLKQVINEKNEEVFSLKQELSLINKEVDKCHGNYNAMRKECEVQNQLVLERNKKVNELESIITEVNRENSRIISNYKNQEAESVAIHKEEVQFLKQKIEKIYENNGDELNLLREKYEAEIFELNKKWNSEVEYITKENEISCQKLRDEIKVQNDILKEQNNKALKENEKYKSLQKQLNENKEQLYLFLDKFKEAKQNNALEVKRFSNQNTKLTEEIKKLKTYMQKLQNEQFEIEKWKQDQYQHNLNIQKFQEKIDDFSKSNEVLQIRFDSLSEILKMQEIAVTNHNETSDQHKPQVFGRLRAEFI